MALLGLLFGLLVAGGSSFLSRALTAELAWMRLLNPNSGCCCITGGLLLSPSCIFKLLSQTLLLT